MKKALAIILSLLFILTMLTGCSARNAIETTFKDGRVVKEIKFGNKKTEEFINTPTDNVMLTISEIQYSGSETTPSFIEIQGTSRAGTPMYITITMYPKKLIITDWIKNQYVEKEIQNKSHKEPIVFKVTNGKVFLEIDSNTIEIGYIASLSGKINFSNVSGKIQATLYPSGVTSNVAITSNASPTKNTSNTLQQNKPLANAPVKEYDLFHSESSNYDLSYTSQVVSTGKLSIYDIKHTGDNLNSGTISIMAEKQDGAIQNIVIRLGTDFIKISDWNSDFYQGSMSGKARKEPIDVEVKGGKAIVKFDDKVLEIPNVAKLTGHIYGFRASAKIKVALQ